MPSPAMIPMTIATLAVAIGVSCTSEQVIKLGEKTWEGIQEEVRSFPTALHGLSGEFRAAGDEISIGAEEMRAWAKNEIDQLRQRVQQLPPKDSTTPRDPATQPH